MGYLYGDLTPFPHDANYIDLIRDMTELCHILLQVDASMVQSRKQVDAEKASIATVVAEFRHMASSMADALQPYLGRQDSPVIKEVSGRLIQSIRGVLEGAQSSLQSRHESNANGTESRIKAEREQTLPALEKLLIHHELPGTIWIVRWVGAQAEGQRAEAQALATTPFGLESSFQLEIPTTLAWYSTIRVSDVKQRVVIQLPRKARRGTVVKPCELERYNITEAALGEVVTRLVLRRGLRAGVPGLEFTWQGSGLSILPLDDDSMLSEPVVLEESDTAIVADLRERVEAHLWSLVDKRVRLVEAKLGGTEVQKLDSPAPLAKMVMKSIAPFCREIIKRTPVEGELSLKRVVEDRRREEIYIKASDLTKIYASLPPSHQAYFDELGLPASAAAGRRAPLPTGPMPLVNAKPEAPAKHEPPPVIIKDTPPIPDAEPITRKTSAVDPKVIVEMAPAKGSGDNQRD